MESLPEELKQWTRVEIERADRFIYAVYFTGALALAMIFLLRKFPKTAGPLLIAVSITGFAAFALLSLEYVEHSMTGMADLCRMLMKRNEGSAH